MEKLIVLLVIGTALEVVSYKHYHRNARRGKHITTTSYGHHNHNSKIYGHHFTTINNRMAYGRSNNNNAYSRRLGIASKRSKSNRHGIEPEDFDHIIVVKNAKKAIPLTPQAVAVDKIISKEPPDFDHTIVVQAKGFNAQDTEEENSASQSHVRIKTHKSIQPVTSNKVPENGAISSLKTSLSRTALSETSSSETTLPKTSLHEISSNARIKPHKSVRPATSPQISETTASTFPTPSIPETTLSETLPETTSPKTSLPETSLPETTSPETTLLQTSLPETSIPEITSPETSLSKTSSHETSFDVRVIPYKSVRPATSPQVSETDVTSLPTSTSPQVSETAVTSLPTSSIPETSLPKTSLSETTLLETSLPLPKTSLPETLSPGTTLPKTSSPGPSLPETSSPELILPITSLHETSSNVRLKPRKPVRPATSTQFAKTTDISLHTSSLPETSLPETSLPETTLPKTSLPDISLPETLSPEITLPKTSSPGTILPETSPETILPKTSLNVTSSDTLIKPRKSGRLETAAISLPAPSLPGTSSPETSLSKTSLPEPPLPDIYLPETTIPNTPLPVPVLPSIFVRPSPPDTSPETSFSGSSSPGGAPGTSFPSTLIPEALLTGSSSPSTSLPSAPMPVLPIPGTTLSKTSLFETYFPETALPSTSLPGTSLPGITETFSKPSVHITLDGNALLAPSARKKPAPKPAHVYFEDIVSDSPLCTANKPCIPRSANKENAGKSDASKSREDLSKSGSDDGEKKKQERITKLLSHGKYESTAPLPKPSAKMKLDDISKGGGTIVGFAVVSKLGCRAQFKHKGGGNQISLKRVFDELFGEGKVPVESSSRRFINADHFHFASDIGMITVCSCGDSRVFKVENLIAITSVMPVKWLELRHVRVRRLEFYYDEMLDQREGTAWNRMSINGYGLSYLGPTKQEALVQFEKAISDSKNMSVDSDISISIQFSNDEYKDTIHVSVFLGIFGQAMTSLYPEPPQMEISRLGLESLSFNRKAPKTHMIKGTISEANQYAVYITGDVSGSNLLSTAKNVYIVCQNDFSIIVNNVNCALIATVDVSAFDFNSVLNDIELTVLAEEVKLFRGGKIPDTVLFQSSKATFDTINVVELQTEINSIARNDKKRDKESSSQAMIIAGSCFRYRLSNIYDQFPNINSENGTDIAVSMCPGIDSVKFYLPDLGTVALSEIPTLISDADPEILKFQKLFGEQQMEVEYVEVTKRDIGGGFKFITKIKPRLINQTGGFHFLPELSFLEIRQTSIKLITEKNKILQLEGSGEETILQSISSFSLGRKANEVTMSGEMKIRSREVLLEALKEWTKREEKEDTNAPFQGIQSLTLRTLRYTATAGVNRVVFSGSALLGENPDAIFQMVVYDYKFSIEVATCIYRENADVSEFINAVYGRIFFSLGWLKAGNIGVLIRPGNGVPEISRFPRELCNIEDYTRTGGTDKITLLLNDFRLNDCERNGRSSDACLFLKRVFNNKVPVKMVGIVRSSVLHLEGYTSREMMLGPNLVLKGTRDHQNEVKNEKIRIKIIVNENVNQITFEGSLKFGGDMSKELPGKIILAGSNIMLEIPESTETDYLDIIRNDKLEFVQLTGTASCKKAISATAPLTMLVVNSAMKVGNTAENAILFDDRNLIKQYIDPSTMDVKMYACKSSNTSMDVNDVLKAFGEGKANIRGLLDKSRLKGLCITYHEGKEKWNIEDLGLEVESGLRITAALESSFGEGGQTSSINAEIRIDDGKSVLCVLLPPQMWAVKERIISSKAGKTRVKVPRMEMYFKEDSQSFGPELCYEVPFVGERAFGYLTGYIKTVGIDTDGEITISALNTAGNMYNYIFEYSGSLFSQVEGSLRLDAIYLGQDLSKVKFKVKIDVLEYTQKVLKEHVLQFTQERSMTATRQLSKAREYLTNFTKWKKQYDDERIVLLTEHQRNKNQFRRRKIERARSMQAFSKDCSHDCGYVRVPGWSVEEKCAKNRNGRYLRCMKYAKDGHVASNVGCVASCESDRVRSLVEARELNEAAKRDGGQVDKTQDCLDLVQDVIQLTGMYVEKMTDSVVEMEKVTKSHRDLALFNVDNIYDKIQIERLDAEVFLDDLDDPSCLPFNIDVKVAFDENDDVVKSYTKIKRCFNGMFVKKLVEFIFEDMMKSDVEAMERYIETMDERYASFERILKRTSKSSTSRKITIVEEEFKQCRSSDVIQPNLRRRSVVESSLSPLTPSLFTIFRDSTVKAFKHNSPWSISKRRDAFGQFIRTQRKPVMHNITHIDNGEHACSAARRAAVDYADIANYVHKWIKEQQAAKRTLSSVQKYIIDDVKMSDLKLNFTNYSRDEVDNMKYWMNKAKEGMSVWLTSESNRIERHNKEGLPVMKKELEFIYTDTSHKNLRDFLTHRSSDGNRALKKANIETPSSSIFLDLSKNLLNVLESGRSLEEISSPMEEIITRIDGLEKRTILCNI